jgi:hypothetical protein
VILGITGVYLQALDDPGAVGARLEASTGQTVLLGTVVALAVASFVLAYRLPRWASARRSGAASDVAGRSPGRAHHMMQASGRLHLARRRQRGCGHRKIRYRATWDPDL